MENKNKRASERILHSVSARIRIGENPPVLARTLDLSKGGVLMDSPLQASVGDTVEVIFKVGRTELNPTTGQVRRVESAFGGRRHCIAVEFSAPNFQLVELIKRDLKELELQSECARLVSSWGSNPNLEP